MPSDQPILRPYARVSQDRRKKGRSPAQQLTVLGTDASENGWAVHPDPYLDNDRSASKYAQKERDDFERLMKDLANGTFGADLLGLWETSRGTRQMEQAVPLANALAAAGVRVWVHTLRRVLDLRNAHDRADFLTAAVKDELSSAETSERVRRDILASALEGRPWGEAPRGFIRLYDPESREFTEQIHDPEWALRMRDAFERIARRESLRSIETAWQQEGVRHSTGFFKTAHIRSMLLSPTYAGLRAVKRPDGSVEYVDAQWEGIVSTDTWFTVKGILEDPTRRTALDGRARYLLSMSTAARCASCVGEHDHRHRKAFRCDGCPECLGKHTCPGELGPSNAPRLAGVPHYACHSHGHLRIEREPLDTLAERVLLGWLEVPENYDALAQPGETVTAELQQVRGQLAHARRDLAEYEDRADRGELSAIEARAAAGTEKKVAELEGRERELSAPTTLVDILGGRREDVRARWKDASVSSKRVAAKLLFSPSLIGEIHVSPVGRGNARHGGPPLEERVRFFRHVDGEPVYLRLHAVP
ncbi:recombinase family protein [Amycolatopsis sp. NPDC088138]|uniref:recombinase family protein n=1 Tax=Amycolatopsis sp. NPDC088138 TaxID=3363938 RepID=UPI0037FC868E